ncbi:Cro/C1-type helix-turn-helix DNA-binding protein [Roseinatronobacter monicus]|uniref:Cro/C1-type helix-turn-helix DNA-binding protein n=2 Tax=Roseinatronobacter monicus TaxID=393481 RepID=A0A543K3R2_9RHOB|nr:Cro/C1-type helix-turn-helix DNA-binding protein [Roseinatronobacter monicus]
MSVIQQGATEDRSEIFRTNLLRLLKERKISAAALSRKAGLNMRAVKDIEERRANSPRIVTVFKLAEALDVGPEVLLGLKTCHCAHDDYLSAAERFFSSLSGDQRELVAAALVQKVDPMYRE